MRQHEPNLSPPRAAILAGLLYLLAGAPAAPAIAAGRNLLTNPGFDTNLGGWSGDGAWAAADALGDVHSGSVLQQIAAVNSAALLYQCVTVEAGASYVYGASGWIDIGGPAGSSTAVVVQFFSGPGCTGSFLTTPTKILATSGHWIDVAGSTFAPPQAQSAHLELFTGRGARDPGLTSRVHFDNAFLRRGSCAAGATTLCLNQGRFMVQVTWTTTGPSGHSGPGMAVPFGDKSGSFWFFDPTNVELDVKVLDGCVPALGNHYWVFAAGLTNVAVDLTVTDTQSAKVRTYHNPQGTVFEPITDTAAFASCP